MDHNKGIYWYQGMFMQPQHFQLASLHEQFRNKPVVESGLPHFWGAGALDIAAGAIASQTIEVRSAKLIFPDRTYVEFPGNAVLAPRSFDASSIGDGRALTVYLGVRKFDAAGNNVTLCASADDAAAASTRYATLERPDEVPDLHSNGPAAPVHTLLHVLKVFFEGETANLGQYDLIPVAQLTRIGDTVTLSERFIAPGYALGGSDTLLRIVREIRDDVVGRAHQLQEFKNPRELQKAEFDPGYMMLLLAMRTLSRAAPGLVHLTQTPTVHPWQVYGALRGLVGELSAFSERFDMLGEAADGTPGLPAYDHTDLYNCFSRAQALIGFLLGEIAVGPEHLAVLDYRDGMFAGDLPRAFFDRRNRFYLVLRTEQAAAQVVDGALHDARLANAADVTRLVAHALPGLELIHMANAPQGMPRRASSNYFRIEQVSELWDAVERDENIALQWPDAPQDLRAEIVVLRR
ncbi:type VI secretion protein [Burkholderia sp. SFA1]|uniref:type VI secretion system baseplate subunit TssK n=1 Tax=Caballeronia sp. CLC5 TaxID=2906764 RepID=UPI001F2D35F9|nr:type VI secretion system baseplate subunit TssK [Caballeronia sp. CLC5]MCE4573797.1 type VI secretion system baseplate subunit TssK [Caballeronia sp. CLC5]BBQ00642.1 type VI secretion protein [Burkholderia sp. SFA1]